MNSRSFSNVKYPGFFLAILVAAIASIAITRTNSFALLFLPSAAIFAALLRTDPQKYRYYLSLGIAAIFSANLLMGLSLISNLLLCILNASEIVLAVSVINWVKPDIRERNSVADLIQISAAYAVFVLPVFSFVSAVALSWHFNLPYFQAWINWYFSSASGLALILLPALMLDLKDFEELISEKNLFSLVAQILIGCSILLLILFLIPRPFIYIAFGMSVLALYIDFLRLNIVLYTSALVAFAALTTFPDHFSEFWQLVDLSNIGGAALCFYFPQLICLARALWIKEHEELEVATDKLHIFSGQIEAILEASHNFAIVACDTEGVINYFNKGAEKLFQYSRDELVGKKSPNILFSKEDAKAFANQISERLNDTQCGIVYIDQAQLGPSYSREWQCVRKGGTKIAIRLSVSKIVSSEGKVNGYVGISADVRMEFATRNALNETLDRLSDQADQVNTLFEQAPDALMLVNQFGKIEKANQQAHLMFAYPKGALIGLSIESLVPDKFKEVHVHHRETYGKAPASRSMLGNKQLEALRKDGVTFPVTVNLSPVWEGGQYSVIATVHDVSIQKEVEERLRNARTLAEEASLAKSNFLANMSHEIRTPLNAILSTAKFIGNTDLNAKQKNYVSTISKAGKNLLNTINDILDYSKIEAGRMEADYHDFSLGDVLDEVIDICVAAKNDKAVELALLIDDRINLSVLGDEQHLRQVLFNLMSNALKFTQEGSVVLQVSLEKALEQGSQKIKFCVTDTGIGIATHMQDEIFQAFAQSDVSISRKFGGTGLGLSISYKLVELMGGTLKLNSELGKGSEFYFSLNLKDAKNPLPVLNMEKDGGADKVKILLLDEGQWIKRSLESFIAPWGWKLVVVDETSEFCNLADEYDCLVLSWPGKAQALELLKPLEESGLRKQVVFIVNNDELEEAEAFSDEHNIALLLKPLLASNVYDVLGRVAGIPEGESRCSTRQDDDSENVEGKNYVSNTGSQEDQVLSESIEKNSLVGLRVLLAEDNDFNQLVARELLSDFEVQLTIVGNGKEALDTLAVAPDSFDLVLMDVQMPEMDGFTATRKIRELGLAIPIVAVTAGVTAKEKNLCLDAGMNDFLSKPLDFDCVEAVLKHWASKRLPQKDIKLEHNDSAETGSKNTNNTLDMPHKAELLETTEFINTEEVNKTEIFVPRTLERMVSHSEERKEKALELLENVMQRLQNGLADVYKLIETGDLDAAKKRLHELRGVIGNFGGLRMAQVMLEVERSLERLFSEDKIEIYNLLKAAHSQLSDSVESWRSQLNQAV